MMIDGVEIESITTHADERGFFREIMRATDLSPDIDIGQVSHSLVHTGIIKAWHGHKEQTQWNYVVNGLINVILYDGRSGSKTFGAKKNLLVGDHQDVKFYSFPPGVLHGYKCISGPMNIIYVTSGVYLPEEELRIPHDDETIGHDWLSTNIK